MRAEDKVDAWNAEHSPGETVLLDEKQLTVTTTPAYLTAFHASAVIHVRGVKGYVHLDRVSEPARDRA